MSKEQSDKMDRMFKKKLAGTIAANWWSAEMSWEEPTEESNNAAPNFSLDITPPDSEPEDENTNKNLFSNFHLQNSDARRGSVESVASSGYSSLYSSFASLAN